MKNKKVEEKEVIIEEKTTTDSTNSPIEQYQWIKGEKAGNVEIVDHTEDINGVHWIYFKSGNRVNKDLLNEFLYRIYDDSDILNIKDDISTKQNSQINENNSNKTIKKQKSPIRILLEKQSINSKEAISVGIIVELPKKEIFNILKDSFPDELEDELISMVLEESIDKKNLEESIKDSIKKYYAE